MLGSVVNAKLLPRVLRDRRGNVTLIFALAALPMLLGIGVAVDLSNATRVRLALQDATDAAVLAVGRAGPSVPQSQLEAVARQYMDASYNYNDIAYAISKVSYDAGAMTARLDTSADVPTTFMAMFGKTVMPVSAHSVSKAMSVEIALVLDTSGSMAEAAGDGTKIEALKQASKALFARMYGSKVLNNRFAISIVPFAASVNVGSGHAGAYWIDKSDSKLNTEDFESSGGHKMTKITALNPSTGMSNASWGGCVISRAKGYDVTDDAPVANRADTLFSPWFAPDEPGPPTTQYTVVNGAPYLNSYLDDNGGDCTADRTIDQLNAETPRKKQERGCKYRGATPLLGRSMTGTMTGPNFLCDSQAITPLTTTRATLDSAVDALGPQGNTNILEGFAWGWRTLSPAEPFTGGKAYDSPNNYKVIILMTDGLNTIGAMPNINQSYYTGYGYMWQKRLRDPATSDETLNRTEANAKTAKACENAKARGIAVYTIAFGSGAVGSRPLLKGCASRPEAPYFNAPVNASELEPVFLKIAESINRMRIAQ
ncbi:MAG TPA: pilus assembly protein TadG-related protein [Caulobacteraceae bacterium]|jgi:Flp pilus assembly protein TadG